MSITIGAPESLATKITEFVKTETLPWSVITGETGTIRVVQSEGQQQSDASTLQAGGWIACHVAFAMAGKLDVPPKIVGKLANLVDTRIKECQLGCF